MKESHSEELATHAGPESCAVIREGGGEALTGVRTGRVSSRETGTFEEADVLRRTEGNMGERVRWATTRRAPTCSSAVLDPEHVRNHSAQELGDLRLGHGARWASWSAATILKEYCADARA